MENHTLLVISDPTDPQLAMLDQLPDKTSIVVGNSMELFERHLESADVLLNWSLDRELMRKLLAACPRLQWIHTRSAGLDNLMFPELVESPIVLTNGTGVFSQSLGEFVLAGILYFAKDFRRMIRSQMAGIWDPFDIVEISGQTVGIVGYGDIGRAVATRVRAMGMRVLAVKRHGPPLYNVDPLVAQVYGPDRLLQMIPQCDYVVVAAPLTPETRSMIGEAEFGAMKPDAVIVNVGRGPVIDEAAMVRALAERRIKGAVLDVFDKEPLADGHPLYGLDNVLLSAHCADHTPDWMEQAMRFFIEQFERFRTSVPLQNIVEKKLGY